MKHEPTWQAPAEHWTARAPGMARQLVPVDVDVAEPTLDPTQPPHELRLVSVSMHSKPPGKEERRRVSTALAEDGEEETNRKEAGKRSRRQGRCKPAVATRRTKVRRRPVRAWRGTDDGDEQRGSGTRE